MMAATLPFLLSVSGYAALGDDPKRTFSLPNDTGGPRLMRRCEDVDECRSPDEGELIQPRESFDFKLYYDEDRTYIVANAQGRTFGCVTVLWPLVSARIRIHSGSDAVSARHAVDLASREDQCASAQPDPGRSDVWVSQCSGMSPEHCRGAEVVERLVWPFASAPFRGSGVQGRSGRWCRSQAMTAHDFADLFDVRGAIAS